MQVIVQQIGHKDRNINMPVAVNQILTFIGIVTASHRTIISEDLLPNPGKLENLIDDTEEGIKDA